jgi:hypothetical protein
MTKTAAKSTERKMEYVQITQAEEMPVLSPEEKAEFIRSLEEAQAQIDRGEGIVFKKPGDFGKWMKEQLAFYRANRSA